MNSLANQRRVVKGRIIGNRAKVLPSRFFPQGSNRRALLIFKEEEEEEEGNKPYFVSQVERQLEEGTFFGHVRADGCLHQQT